MTNKKTIVIGREELTEDVRDIIQMAKDLKYATQEVDVAKLEKIAFSLETNIEPNEDIGFMISIVENDSMKAIEFIRWDDARVRVTTKGQHVPYVDKGSVKLAKVENDKIVKFY